MRLLLLLIAGFVIYRLLKGFARASAGRRRMNGQTPPRIDDVMVQDPQCGVYFPRRDGVPLTHEGHELLFCSEACRQAYLKRPAGE